MPSLPNNVRYLEWKDCSFRSIPSRFLPAELVFLQMPGSSIMHLEKPLDDHKKAKEFMNLIQMDFRGCTDLKEIVDFSAFPNLEEMDFSKCKNLKKIGVTIGNLKKLRRLILQQCDSLRSLPSLEENQSLVHIDVGGCSKLKNLSNLPTTITHLILSSSGIEKIPLHYTNLSYLEASNCSNLSNLPNPVNTSKFFQICKLYLCGCERLDEIPQLPHTLPVNTSKFFKISELYLRGCERLVEIPQLPHTLKLLDASECKSLKRFSQFQLHNFYGIFGNCYKMTENEKQSWRKMVEKMSMKRKEDFPSTKYSVRFPGKEISQWFSYSFNYEHTRFQVPVPEFNSNVIGIAFCVIVQRATSLTEFYMNEFLIKALYGHGGHQSEHMWLVFFAGSEWSKLFEAQEVWCKLEGARKVKRVGVHYIYEN